MQPYNGSLDTEITPAAMRNASNHSTGPTVESLSSDPGHDTSKPPIFVRFFRWLQNPMNLMLFLWLIPVVIGLIFVALIMFGAFNHAIPQSDRRKRWEEYGNQVLNALFTVGCLFTHPEVFYHLVYVVRWSPRDQEAVRKVYCRYKTPGESDRKHLLVVVSLINLTWVGQYIMCGLYWGFNRHNRPNGLMTFWIVVTLFAPVVASVYTVKGPLKNNKTAEEKRAIDEEIALREILSVRLCSGGAPVQNPQWDGGVFDCCEDTTVCFSSFFCLFCTFGRNTHKLGFGSRNLHAVTFFIAVCSPFAVFLITAIKIHYEPLKVVCIVSGAILSWVGFLYGGYWRIKMRERFDLPDNGRGFMADYFAWLFCGPCALSQEVRTANNYDVEEGDVNNEMVSARRFEGNRSFSYPPNSGHAAEGLGRSASETQSKAHVMAVPQRPYM